MTPEEELQAFRDQQPLRLERARRIALRFGIAAIIALIACVYAFFQQTASERQQIQNHLDLQYINEKLKAAEERALKAESLAMNETVRTHQLSEECQQKQKTAK